MWSDTAVGCLKPVWYLSKLFLLNPRSIDEKIRNKGITKLWQIIYNAVSVSVTLYLFCVNCNYRISPDISIVLQMATLIFQFLHNVTMLATVFPSLLYQNKLTVLVARLNKIDMKMTRLFKHQPYKNVKIFVATEMVFIISLWFPFSINFIFVQCKTSYLKCFNNWLTLYTSTKMAQVMIMKFCAFVAILKHQLSVINRNIKEFLKNENKSTEKTLDEIEKIYDEIMIACSEVQSIFSFPILFKIACYFVAIFCGFYFCTFGYLYNDRVVKPQSFSDVIMPLFIIGISLIELLTIVILCELTVLEYRSTGKLIYRIPFIKHNNTLMKRINIFSLQLLHTNFDFTASGLFKINCSLLQTILGAVTVYLVMFIQFDIATNKAQS